MKEPTDKPCKYCIYLDKFGSSYWCNRIMDIEFSHVTNDAYEVRSRNCFDERLICKGRHFQGNYKFRLLNWIASKFTEEDK